MRVVAGIYRHRELKLPNPKFTRPTKDMVKEALFSALGDRVHNSTILDLFAGSGALAIEALSRGAKFAYLVDNNLDAINTININLNNLKIKNVKVMMMDYLLAVNKIKTTNELIDIVFIDPPYAMNDYQSIINQISPILNSSSIIVIESDALIKINYPCQKVKEYKYGKTFVTILWK